MKRLIPAILFKNQDARPLRVVRIVLNYDGRLQTVDDITHVDTVCRKLLVPVK
jgi:hypothetical protein